MEREQGMMEAQGSSKNFPTWERMDKGFVTSTVALVIVMLPGLVAKFLAFGSNESQSNASSSFVFDPAFNASVTLIGFVLALIGLKLGKDDVSARVVAIFALIVCVLRLVLQG